MEEGKPTGIKRQDLERREIDFEGRRAQIVQSTFESRVGIGNALRLELDLGDEYLVLWGYVSAGEFMEVDRRRLYRGRSLG